MNVWKCLGILFWSTEASWARIADGKSLYHLGLIFGATVLLERLEWAKIMGLPRQLYSQVLEHYVLNFKDTYSMI